MRPRAHRSAAPSVQIRFACFGLPWLGRFGGARRICGRDRHRRTPATDSRGHRRAGHARVLCTRLASSPSESGPGPLRFRVAGRPVEDCVLYASAASRRGLGGRQAPSAAFSDTVEGSDGRFAFSETSMRGGASATSRSATSRRGEGGGGFGEASATSRPAMSRVGEGGGGFGEASATSRPAISRAGGRRRVRRGVRDLSSGDRGEGERAEAGSARRPRPRSATLVWGERAEAGSAGRP